MALKNIFDMVKADKYTQDGRDELIKAQEVETEDVKYEIGQISQKTGLQKTANGWVKPRSGKAPGAKTGEGKTSVPEKGSKEDVKQRMKAYVDAMNKKNGEFAGRSKKLAKSMEEVYGKPYEPKAKAESKPAEKKRPKAISWKRENLPEMREKEQFIKSDEADNFYHQWGLDKTKEYKDSDGRTVKQYENDDGDIYRVTFGGPKFMGSDYEPVEKQVGKKTRDAAPRVLTGDTKIKVRK